MTPLDTFSSLVRQRRTVKPADMDAARPVDRALIASLLECATWAPTHGLTEPWRFRVYQGESRLALATALPDIYRRVMPPEEVREDKLQKFGENPRLAPVVIAVWMQRSIGHKVPPQEELEAVACAVQNLMLAATAAGLGSFWSSPPLLESAEFKSWLGIGEEDQCLGLIYLGWPRHGAPVPARTRRPVDSVATWA